MKLRTEIKPLNHQGLITHDRPLMMIGSCFSDNIGLKLKADLFDVTVNPWGTLYNPASIASAIDMLCGDRNYTCDDLIDNRHLSGTYISLSHHSSLSCPTPDESLHKMNSALMQARSVLPAVQAVVITLGTIRSFFDIKTNRVVANCHKLPASRFIERHLDVEETEKLLNQILHQLHLSNPCQKVIFTVSPIRHSGASLADNSLSKATLRVAVDRVVKNHADYAFYFPAYEIMIDDLRDYRFYADDMKHPSAVAIDYIYGLFMESFMTSTTISTAEECRKYSRRIEHRPIGMDGSPGYQQFIETTAEMAHFLTSSYPYLKTKIQGKIKR